MQWLMLQQNKPEDYVISTGRAESVRFYKLLIIWDGGKIIKVLFGKEKD